MNKLSHMKGLPLDAEILGRRTDAKDTVLLIAMLLASLLLSSCLPGSPRESPPWAYADLRLLLPANGSDPRHEITAVYARDLDTDFQIRLDLLQSPEEVDYDLYLALDTAPGGGGAFLVDTTPQIDWDILIHIPAKGRIQAVNSDGEPVSGLRLRLHRDTTLDLVVISMDRQAMNKPKGGISFQVFLVPTGEQLPASYSGVLSSDGWRGKSPPPRVEALLVFWDTFPAASPAQALRRWDGAHTGPNSERHGLHNLLRALSETRTPAVLLDLKTPSSLSALHYAGGLPMVQEMEESRLLAIPDAAWIASAWSESIGQPSEWAIRGSIQESRTAGKEYGFRPSPYLYLPSRHPPPSQALVESRYRLIFNKDIYAASLPQAAADGPTLEVRLALLDLALESNISEKKPLILGGSFAESTWGDYQAALQTLRYLKSRPWITFPFPENSSIMKKAPNLADQVQIHGREVLTPGVLDDRLSIPEILVSLRESPPGIPTQLAWQFYNDLLSPPSPVPDNLAELRRGYLGAIRYFLAAANWADDPTSSSKLNGCDTDLDGDGRPECILASEDIFLILKPEGGYAALGFARTASGIHQFLGQSAQFLVGLSDPTIWKPELGQAGDPNQFRGAFSDIQAGFGSPSWETYTADKADGRVVFKNANGSIEKTFQLIPGGLSVDYSTGSRLHIQIPLVLDPGSRLSPGWRDLYQMTKDDHKLVWYIEGGPRLELSSEEILNVQAFTDSREAVLAPENPNYEFLPGHFLPFPLVLAELTAQGKFSIELLIFD